MLSSQASRRGGLLLGSPGPGWLESKRPPASPSLQEGASRRPASSSSLAPMVQDHLCFHFSLHLKKKKENFYIKKKLYSKIYVKKDHMVKSILCVSIGLCNPCHNWGAEQFHHHPQNTLPLHHYSFSFLRVSWVE